MFHKGDIAIKYIFKAGKYGGLTDFNVKVASDETTVIDYKDFKKSDVFKPSDWQKIDLPHDWLIEGNFINDNSLGSQPAATGFLPPGIGFYRKEFEIAEEDKGIGKKKSVPFTKQEWELVYKPGKLEARGYNKARTVAKDVVETTAAPAQIALNSDCSTLKADGCDVAVIRVAINDVKGRVVPVADNLVKFSI